MTDVFSKAKRSEVMSLIRSRGNTATELAFMALLRAHKITGWRRHLSITLRKSRRSLNRKGHVTPDFVFKRLRIAVFIDGCFWHACPRHSTTPSSNIVFWKTKLSANRQRDRHVTRMLKKQDWTVFRIWEHQLKKGDRAITLLKRKMLQDMDVPMSGDN